jgi:uncharacterized protein YggE
MRSLVAFVVLAASGFAPAAFAQDQCCAQDRGPILNVSAEGVVEDRPDLATVSIGVVTEGETARAAAAENARQMASLTQVLRRAGVAERDVQTSHLSITPVYNDNRRSEEPRRIIGYEAKNRVRARVRRIERLGEILIAAVDAGGNQLQGVAFSLQNPGPSRDAARREAVEEARRLADLYARAAGLSVKRIISISPGDDNDYRRYAEEEIVVTGSRAASTPIESGEVATRAHATVVFELQ